MVHKTKKNKTKTKRNMCWTPLHVNKHKSTYKRITYMHRNENNKHMDTKKTPSSVNDHNQGIFCTPDVK